MVDKQRRDFLKKTGVAAGAGLIGATGMASAAGMNLSHFGENSIGDPWGDYGAKFRLLMSDTRGSGQIQTELDKATSMMQDAVDKSSYLSGAYIQMYTFDADYWGGQLARPLDDLDQAASDAGLTDNSYTLVWDCKDAHYHTDDWPQNFPGSKMVPYSDPAFASSNWHPTYYENVDGDGHLNEMPHARVTQPPVEPGRMGHAALTTLTRTRDAWPWETADDPPGIYNPGHEWELGGVVQVNDGGYLKDPGYRATGHGSSLNDSRLETTDQGTCSGDGLGSNYRAMTEYEPEVTYCTSDTISDAIEWFHL